MRRRIFVALPISKDSQNKIEEWGRDYQNLPVRWIKGKNLHVTLIPPWYTAKVHEVIDRLKSLNNVIEPFTITFQEVAFGPNSKRPRLIWASGDSPSKIITLKSKLEECLGRKKEKREFMSHLTIARFKKEDFAKFLIKNLPRTMSVRGLHDKVFWQEKVSSFLLMESHLKRGGAEYEKLAEIPL